MEEKRLREREELMREIQMMKNMAQQEMECQREDYERRLLDLESQMVREGGRGGEGGRKGGREGRSDTEERSQLRVRRRPPPSQEEQSLEVTMHQRTKEETESQMEELRRQTQLLEEETVTQKHLIQLEKLKTEKVRGELWRGVYSRGWVWFILAPPSRSTPR